MLIAAAAAVTEDHDRVGVIKTLADVGLECSLFPARRRGAPLSAWQKLQADLQGWLRGLPKPVAVLTWTSDRAREVIYGCRAIGLLVPEQVAVIGGGDDKVLCETCNPPLSAVALPSERIGYEAAALLDRLMQGKRGPGKRILIEPIRVVVRRSTDTLAIEDQDLARAIAFIRVNASTPIQVSDVLRAVPVSRSWLERRFQEALGRGPAEEIRTRLAGSLPGNTFHCSINSQTGTGLRPFFQKVQVRRSELRNVHVPFG